MRGVLSQEVWPGNPDIGAPRKYREPCTYATFTPAPISSIELDVPVRIVAAISHAESAIATLNQQAQPSLAPFARLLLRTESIASSKVEGIYVTPRALARAEAAGLEYRAASQVQEVMANIDAMELAIDQVSQVSAITVEHIMSIHAALMQRTRPDIAGKIRSEQNWIGGNDFNPCGATFVPPPHQVVHALLEDLCVFCNQEDLSPLVAAAIAHAQFETIHPFSDGNGRTGRALIHIVLRRRGIATSYVPPISVVLAGQKGAYIQGLERFRNGEVAEWIEEFSSAAARAAGVATSYLGEVQDLQSQWRQSLRENANPRADAAAWALIDELPGVPVITTTVATAATRRSRSQVTHAITQLEEAGVLTPLSKGSRNRTWEATGLLDLLDSLQV